MNPPAGVAVSLVVLAACQPSPRLVGADPTALRQVMDEVDGDAVMANIRDVVDSHLSDTPMDCSIFESDYEPWCHLTHEKTRALVQEKLERLGFVVTRQLTEDGPFTTVNLIADLVGSTQPDHIVLVGAHYDALFGGANDNGSGVAGVLELARVLSHWRFEQTIRLVAFDLEELGTIGSSRFARDLSADETLTAAIILDCIAYADDRAGSQRGFIGYPWPTQGDFLSVVGNERSSGLATDLWALNDLLDKTELFIGLGPGTAAYPASGVLVASSDHGPLWLEGRPVLMLSDTCGFRSHTYHTPDDTLSTLNPSFVTGTLRLSAAAISYWAGGPR